MRKHTRESRTGEGPTAVVAGPSLEKTGHFPAMKPDPTAPEPLPYDASPDPALNRRRAPRALRVERSGAEPVAVTLYPDRTYVFGRAPESSFVFPSDAVSRLHAQLRFNGEAWLYRDLNSSNGSHLVSRALQQGDDPRIGARPIAEGFDHVARPGDIILLSNGDSRLVFLDSLEGEPPSARPAVAEASAATRKLERAIDVCTQHRLPVFLLGPSGSGKTYVARTIHERARMEGLFVILNCGRLPQDPAQLASELLGHVAGAFTGAIGARKGKLLAADHGTLFLDEVESLPRAAQDFLIDVLEGTGSFAPFGASGEFKAPPPRFRLISASKAPLARSGLRPDLCQRLAAGDMIVLPGLEERREDIPRLVESFLAAMRDQQRVEAVLTDEALAFLQKASWPGEIRELESTVKVVVSRESAGQKLDGASPQRLVVGVEAIRNYLEQRAQGFGQLDASRLRDTLAPSSSSVRKRPVDLTSEELVQALQAHGGNKTRAAAALGIALNTFKAKLKAFGLAQ